jgi:hypothetical protein
LAEEVLHVAIAESEAVVEPHGVADDRGREAVPGIADDVDGHAGYRARGSPQFDTILMPPNLLRHG